MPLEIESTVQFAEFCQERSHDENLARKLEFAERWGSWVVWASRGYSTAIQESILPALQIANNADRSTGQYWQEGNPLVCDEFEVVIGAAEILSRFWKHAEDFRAFTVEAPYENSYGNWRDPKTESSVEVWEGHRIRQERLAALQS
jgi:hypothetical protein